VTHEFFIGIDIGKNGGIAILDAGDRVSLVTKMPKTRIALIELLKPFSGFSSVAAVEQVHSSPQMGVTSAFSFGGQKERVLTVLTALDIPFDEVRPLDWQRTLQCINGGDKNVTKRVAEMRFPRAKVTHATADALLIASFCRIAHDGTRAPNGRTPLPGAKPRAVKIPPVVAVPRDDMFPG
jgi:hypothetical protein